MIYLLYFLQLCEQYLLVPPKPGVDLIKPLYRKFTNSFGKLDLFIALQQIMLLFLKWSSLQKVEQIYAKIVLLDQPQVLIS